MCDISTRHRALRPRPLPHHRYYYCGAFISVGTGAIENEKIHHAGVQTAGRAFQHLTQRISPQGLASLHLFNKKIDHSPLRPTTFNHRLLESRILRCGQREQSNSTRVDERRQATFGGQALGYSRIKVL